MNDFLLNKYPRVEEVILTLVSRGAGVSPDPCRSVTQVHHKDGTFIAEMDPCVDVPTLKKRLQRAEEMLRWIWQKHEALSDGDRERIDQFFDPEPL